MDTPGDHLQSSGAAHFHHVLHLRTAGSDPDPDPDPPPANLITNVKRFLIDVD